MHVPLRLNAPAYGWLLGLATVAVLVLVAHHPMADLHDKAQGLENIAAVAGQTRMVHGGMIALVLLFATGFSGFAWRLGVAHPLVMAGWLSYLSGCVVMILAALFDGFVVADVAARLAGDRDTAYTLITFCGILIQAFAKLGFVLMGVGAGMWGKAMLHRKGATLWLGVFAILVGAGAVVFIVAMPWRFDVARLFAYMAVQAVWHIAVAVWLIRNPLPADAPVQA